MTEAITPPGRVDGLLVVGGMAHDMDYARLELLTVFAGLDHVRLEVAPDFERLETLERAAFVVAYTCNVEPSSPAAGALKAFVERGGRLLGLHATNSLLAWTAAGVAARPDTTRFLETLGSEFLAHPPLGAFTVDVVDGDHPLTAGIEAFETVDELYLSRMLAPARVLLGARFTGRTPGFVACDWPDDAVHPVLYLRSLGRGEVAYFNLGHARGHYDAPHRMPFWPDVEHGSWQTPGYRKVLQRCLRWAAGCL